jgi:HlyD family secretion protein
VRPSEGTPPRSFALRAPVAGQVLRVLQGSEATVALGTALLELGDIRRLEVVAELLTNDAIAAVPGSRVLIERWGGPGTLEGRVKRVEPGGFTKVSALGVEEQRVRVLIDITSPAPQWKALGDGFRVSVRIVTLAQDNALLVPVSAVFPLPTTAGKAATAAPSAPASPAMPATAAPAMPGTSPPAAPSGAADNGAGSGGDAVPHHAVFVAEGGRTHLRPVVLRGRNGHMAWLNGTLPVGTQVIVYPPPTVSDGVRIAARKV